MGKVNLSWNDMRMKKIMFPLLFEDAMLTFATSNGMGNNVIVDTFDTRPSDGYYKILPTGEYIEYNNVIRYRDTTNIEFIFGPFTVDACPRSIGVLTSASSSRPGSNFSLTVEVSNTLDNPSKETTWLQYTPGTKLDFIEDKNDHTTGIGVKFTYTSPYTYTKGDPIYYNYIHAIGLCFK